MALSNREIFIKVAFNLEDRRLLDKKLWDQKNAPLKNQDARAAEANVLRRFDKIENSPAAQAFRSSPFGAVTSKIFSPMWTGAKNTAAGAAYFDQSDAAKKTRGTLLNLGALTMPSIVANKLQEHAAKNPHRYPVAPFTGSKYRDNFEEASLKAYGKYSKSTTPFKDTWNHYTQGTRPMWVGEWYKPHLGTMGSNLGHNIGQLTKNVINPVFGDGSTFGERSGMQAAFFDRWRASQKPTTPAPLHYMQPWSQPGFMPQPSGRYVPPAPLHYMQPVDFGN